MFSANVLSVIAPHLLGGDVFWASCCCKSWRRALSTTNIWNNIKIKYLGEQSGTLDESKQKLKAAIWQEYKLVYGHSYMEKIELFLKDMPPKSSILGSYFLPWKLSFEGNHTIGASLTTTHPEGWELCFWHATNKIPSMVQKGTFPSSVTASTCLDGIQFVACKDKKIYNGLIHVTRRILYNYPMPITFIFEPIIHLPYQATAVHACTQVGKKYVLLHIGTSEGFLYRYMAAITPPKPVKSKKSESLVMQKFNYYDHWLC